MIGLKTQKSTAIIISLLIIVVALVIAGLALNSYLKASARPLCWPYCPNMTDQDRVQIKQSMINAQKVEWKTYTNKQFSFEFRYPATWGIVDENSSVGDPNQDFHMQLATVGQEPVVTGKDNIDPLCSMTIDFIPKTQGLTLAEYVRQIYRDDTNATSTEVLISNITGIKMNNGVYFLPYKNDAVMFTLHDYAEKSNESVFSNPNYQACQKIIDKLVLSFKFTSP
jgi:hypothetical protein